MKKFNIKALWLAALLCCGAWNANAQGTITITPGNTSPNKPCYCMDSDAAATTFTLNGNNLNDNGVQGQIISTVWEVSGGISEVQSSATSITVIPKQGTAYNNDYSRYGKGRIKGVSTVEYTYTYDYMDCPADCNDEPTLRQGSHTYYKEIPSERDICKIFEIPDEYPNGTYNNNKIIGPECVTKGDSVTYSIAPWITQINPERVGYDIYNWFPDGIPSFVRGQELYYSADKSSVTFVVDDLTGTDIISVQVGCCNTPNNVLQLPLRSAIPAPVISPLSCVPGGVHDEIFNIQNVVSGVEYTWSSDSWTRIGTTNKGVSMTYQTNNTGAANIRVEANYTNGGTCQSVFSITQVTRSFGTSSKIVTQSGNNCLEAGVPVKFIIQNAPTPATFDWNYDELTDWTFANVEATEFGDEITLIPGTSAVSGEKLRATLNGCDNSYREFEFNIKPGNAGAISSTGGFCVEKNQTYTFSIDPVTPAPDHYQWNLGEGWIIDFNNNGTSITARPTGNIIADSIRVTPIGLNSCNGKSKAVAVAYPPTAPQGINVPGPTSCINSGMADNITLSVIGGSTNQKYTWTLNGLGTITNNTTSPSIDVATSGIDDVYTVSVSAYTNNDVCPQSAPVSDIVTIAGVDFTVIEHVLTATKSFYAMTPNGWSNRHYSILWELDGSNETFTGNSYETNEIYPGLLETTSPYDFRVTVTKNADQCKTVRSWGGNATAQSNSLRSFSLQSVFQNPRNSKVSSLRTLQVGNNATMTISPNPANGLVDIAFSNTGNADIQIRDMAGRIVKILSSTTQNVTVDISNLVSGSYVVLATQNGKNFKEILIVK